MTFSCGYLRRRRCKKFESQFPDALAMLNANMRAGISLANAMQNVAKQSAAPMSQELGMLEKELQVGKNEQAYRNLGSRIPLPSVALFVSAVITCDRLGGNLSEMLDKIAETIRRNIQLRQELKTLTAEGRLQGIIMGFLPFIMGGILTLIDPDMMRPLYDTTLGNLIIVAVVILDLIGLLVIREILKIED
jgi:tight adherence protein B